MRSAAEINSLLDELESRPADELERQDLDFKQWPPRSRDDAVGLVVEMAVCMANGGGGTVVFGVNDKAIGRASAIVGIPPEIDPNLLKKAVYDRTDPKITPLFEDVFVSEGSGRVLVMTIFGGLAPYTDSAGRAKIRIGKECQPLTGTLRRRVMVETGETDYTATTVPGTPASHVSASAMERLRSVARQERAPEDLLGMTDHDLLANIGVLRHGALTRAGLLIAGKTESLAEHLPGYVVQHLRMLTDTDYSDAEHAREAIPTGLGRLIERINAENPITTLRSGLHHYEYRTYPETALREAVMNALCHADYRLPGPILVKQFLRKLVISNPGGFIGGISPDNILHHQPVARNPRLVDALTRLRLVNRSNLGVSRMYSEMLIQGKEPPVIEERGESVQVTFLAGEASLEFRTWVAEQSEAGLLLSVDQLLVLQYLLRRPEIDAATAARIAQRSDAEARELLNEMEVERGFLERGGTGRGTYYVLRAGLHARLRAAGSPDRIRRIGWEAAKTRVLSVLMEHARSGQEGLTNADIRGITHLDRAQVKRLMEELRREAPVKIADRGRYARWFYGER
jgi:ATP-dependent DNA helicase RecG